MTATAERLRHLETMEAIAPVGPQHLCHWSNDAAIDNVAQTIIPGGAQDVTALLTIVYAAQLIGVGVAGGVTTCAPGATVNLYNAGGNTLTVTVAAGGEATIARSAGAGTYNVSLWLVWL